MIIPTWDEYTASENYMPQLVIQSPYQDSSDVDSTFEEGMLSGAKLANGIVTGVLTLGNSSTGYILLDGQNQKIIMNSNGKNQVGLGEV